jgi:hypothetical protein
LPASMPKPLTTLTTPGGRMSAISSITTRMPSGVCPVSERRPDYLFISYGMRTTQNPLLFRQSRLRHSKAC